MYFYSLAVRIEPATSRWLFPYRLRKPTLITSRTHSVTCSMYLCSILYSIYLCFIYLSILYLLFIYIIFNVFMFSWLFEGIFFSHVDSILQKWRTLPQGAFFPVLCRLELTVNLLMCLSILLSVTTISGSVVVLRCYIIFQFLFSVLCIYISFHVFD